MLRHAENQRAQCPTVVPVPKRTPAKPALSKSSNNFPGEGPLSLFWAMRASNKRQRCFGICKENQQSLTQKIITDSRASLSFFGFLPLAAGSVVIGRLSAADAAFIFDGIARDVGFFSFFLSELASPTKQKYPSC
jgi:hypothetical protein